MCSARGSIRPVEVNELKPRHHLALHHGQSSSEMKPSSKGVRSDYGQEEWPHVYADSMMFDMSKEEGEELAPGMATVVFEDALPEEAELDSGDPAELELGYEETGGPATSAFIGTAEGRETLLTLLTGMMSVPGPGETRAFRSWSDTPERAAPRV
ncbi:hypothetical protein PC116_g15021 [Phytophthora cactorum]|nr:hypothetical protein PC119_g11721 [Phytophthora cactorum]KAG4236897.1 hypothetical protein PC116_g15021 [Phytophthora cactorum]